MLLLARGLHSSHEMIRAVAGARARWRPAFLRSIPRRASSFSSSSSSSPSFSELSPPDVARLAETARIALSPKEVHAALRQGPHRVEEFGPKVRQVVEWFGQLQAVNLENLQPALRADTQSSTRSREDFPEAFQNREAMLASVPCFEKSFIKVPKVLITE